MNVFANISRPIATKAAHDALAAAATRDRERRRPNKEFPAIENPWGLSSQQAAVLQYLVDGYGNKQIADLMCVSVHTVVAHRAKVHGKMDVRSILRAAILWDRFIRDAKLARMHKFLPEPIA